MHSLDFSRGSWLRLSHVLSSATPSYGGGDRFEVEPRRLLSRGDSCNAVVLAFSNHLGSHVDAPRHFLAEGRSVDQYLLDEWMFPSPLVVNIPASPGEVLAISHFEAALSSTADAGLLLVRTGFEKWRGQDLYWTDSPAYDPALAAYLCGRLPSLRAIGMDTISLSSCRHREMGRLAHRAFLGARLRIFEDLALAEIPAPGLGYVVALPLLFEGADGAPCTVAGFVAG